MSHARTDESACCSVGIVIEHCTNLLPSQRQPFGERCVCMLSLQVQLSAKCWNVTKTFGETDPEALLQLWEADGQRCSRYEKASDGLHIALTSVDRTLCSDLLQALQARC